MDHITALVRHLAFVLHLRSFSLGGSNYAGKSGLGNLSLTSSVVGKGSYGGNEEKTVPSGARIARTENSR